MSKLRDTIIKASEHLDPQHQGDQWPDPIAWDGRDLSTQARDLCALLDARAYDGDERAAALAKELRSQA